MSIYQLIKLSFKEMSKHLTNLALLFFIYNLIILGINSVISYHYDNEYIRYIYFVGKTLTFSLYSLLLTHFIYYLYYAKQYETHYLLRSIIYPLEHFSFIWKHLVFIVFLGVGSNFTYLFKGVNPNMGQLLINPSLLSFYGNMNYLFMLSVFLVLVYTVASLSASYFIKSTSLSNFFFYGLDCLTQMSIIASNMKFLEYKGLFLKIIVLGLIISIAASLLIIFSLGGLIGYMLNVLFSYMINMWVFLFIASTTVHLHYQKSKVMVS